MAGKILDGLYVYPGEKQVCDIGVAKNMWCYLKVNGMLCMDGVHFQTLTSELNIPSGDALQKKLFVGQRITITVYCCLHRA